MSDYRNLSPEAQAYQRQADQQLSEARENIRRAEAAEQARIQRLVSEASRSTDEWHAEQQLKALQAEQGLEAARQAREAKIEAEQRAEAERRYRAAGGKSEDFERWYAVERVRQLDERMQDQQAAARILYRRSF